jgi:hypothetical protein
MLGIGQLGVPLSPERRTSRYASIPQWCEQQAQSNADNRPGAALRRRRRAVRIEAGRIAYPTRVVKVEEKDVNGKIEGP